MTDRNFVTIQWFKRGAKWSDGKPRMCNRCTVERTRGNRAVVTAIEKSASGYRMPVAYCEQHIPRGIQ